MPPHHRPDKPHVFTDHNDQGRVTVINIHDNEGLRLWCLAFQVNRERLLEAVREAGTNAEAVQQYLARHP